MSQWNGKHFSLNLNSTFFVRSPVWPDVGIKSSPKCPKQFSRKSHNSFYLQSFCFHRSLENFQIFGPLLFQNIAQSGHTGTDTTSARSILWMKSYNISPFKAVFELFQSLISVAYLMNGPLGATTMKNILLLKTAVLTLWIQSAIYNDKMAVLNGKILSLVTAHGVKSNATATVQTTKLIIFFDC